MARSSITAAQMRVRILRTFRVTRRWMGFYLIRHDGDLGGSAMDAYCAAIRGLIDQGRLLEIYDADPRREFWVYLATELLPSPEQLAERAGQSSTSGGPTLCPVPSVN